MYLQITKKYWVHKSQICKVPHLRKVGKSNKLFMSADLWIWETNLQINCPPLKINYKYQINNKNMRKTCSFTKLSNHIFATKSPT